MNGYELTRDWFDFRFENPDKCRPIHTELYIYMVDQWNRLGQVNMFGLPTQYTMQVLNINSYNTFKSALDKLVEFGFVNIVSESRNQHQSRVVALSKNDKANSKALYKALCKATTKALYKATDTIIEQENNTEQGIIEHIETDKEKPIENESPNGVSLFFKEEKEKPIVKEETFNFQKELEKICPDKQLVKDWLVVRKTKKAANTLTAYRSFLNQVEKSKKPIEEVLSLCIENSWKGFQAEWLKAQNPTFGAKPQIQNHFRSR